MTKPKTFKSYSDSGHGWMAVKRQYLVDLGILDKVSPYSYQRGLTVYLEEDCDVQLFINTIKAAGVEFVIAESSHWVERSPIRSYDSFKI